MAKDFHMNYSFPVSVEKLYEVVSTGEGVRKWWTQFANIGSEIGSTAEFRFPKAGFYVRAEISALHPNKLVEWKVFDSMHPEASGFSNLRDWEGTIIRFEMEEVSEENSILKFSHIGLIEELECYRVCEKGWTSYLSSLQQLLVSGAGNPYKVDSEN
ncbi:SRPBCC domain-containing protein [Bacillus sp. X1(2014)]|uniref:SRPBCC domain-containing protein n=1 Tax=Bacillus sp. X1(2014) TaxID=1565991 RepID=UPI0016432D21|nr:SRPBCC domain-containing protein [Bacillus sp. X1(2014)]